jgi:hypothetical protein
MTLALSAMVMSAEAQTTLYGLTDANGLFTISNPNTPGTMNGPYTISGVASGQTLVALDSRPRNGVLYALGYVSASGQAQLYTITDNGNNNYSATSVGSAVNLNLGTNSSIGFNFVSTADNQIMITGTNGNNYVMNATNGSISATGSAMAWANGDVHSGSNAAIGGMTYLNNYYGADNTIGVGYDLTNNVLVTLNQGNYGNNYNYTGNIVSSMGITSGLLLNLGNNVGMANWYNNTNHTNTIYLTGQTLLGTHLYSYQYNNNGNNLGVITDLGVIGNGTVNVDDISFMNTPDTSTNISGNLMAALSLNLRNLVFFNSQNGQVRNMLHLNGMTSGQTMVAITYGTDLNLYGLGYNSNNQTYQLYLVDTVTGNVTAMNQTAGTLNLGTDNGSGLSISAAMTYMANMTNRIRVIGNNGQTNVMLDATSGAIVETDSAITYVNGDANFGLMANLSSIAYADNGNGGNNQMYGYDVNTGAMVQFNANNNNMGNGNGSSGYLSTMLSLNGLLNLFGNNNGYNNGYLDIAFNSATSTNIGYMANNYYGDSAMVNNYSTFYTMNNVGNGGTPTMVNSIGNGIPVKSMTARKEARTTSIANIANVYGNGIVAYPNPTPDATKIVLPYTATQTVTVDVIDLNGRIVRSYSYGAGSNTLDVDMSKLETGMYNARIITAGSKEQDVKLIKQ